MPCMRARVLLERAKIGFLDSILIRLVEKIRVCHRHHHSLEGFKAS